MIYELRIYHAMPGRMPDLLDRFRAWSLAFSGRLVSRQVGYRITVDAPSHLQRVYMPTWESMGERQEEWDTVSAVPEWREVLVAPGENGVIVAKAENMLLRPTDFSELQ